MHANAKMIPVETIPGMGGTEVGVHSSMIYLINCKKFVNANTYPHQAQQ
jgi:hypothetical protein